MLKLEMLVNIVFRHLHSGCLGGFQSVEHPFSSFCSS
jgi:hypothetical protein